MANKKYYINVRMLFRNYSSTFVILLVATWETICRYDSFNSNSIYSLSFGVRLFWSKMCLIIQKYAKCWIYYTRVQWYCCCCSTHIFLRVHLCATHLCYAIRKKVFELLLTRIVICYDFNIIKMVKIMMNVQQFKNYSCTLSFSSAAAAMTRHDHVGKKIVL